MSLESATNLLKERAANANPLGATLKFELDGEGHIFLDGSEKENVVSNDDKEAECTVKMTLEDLEAMMGGDLNPMAAFMGGKLKVDGNMGIAMKLQSLMA